VLEADLQASSLKKRLPAKPLIDHRSQGILVARPQRATTYLLRSHVIGRTFQLVCLEMLVAYSRRGKSDAEITKPDLAPWSKQHVLGLDITVDQPVIVYILQPARDLQDDGQDGADGECSPLRKMLLEIPARGILHHKVRGTTFNAKTEHSYDVLAEKQKQILH
jgi:hypothetical protein